MRCTGCGSENAPTARFCAACGSSLSPSAALVPVARQPGNGALAPSAAAFCPSCQQRTVPQPFFSRGINLAKLAVLFPFTTFVGPLLFFLLRKDRVVCAWCRSLLPGEVPTGLAEAFTAAPPAAARHGAHGAALVATGNTETRLAVETASREIADLERRSRRNRTRAWLFGGMTSLFVLGGGVAAIDSPDPLAPMAMLTGLSGAGAVVTSRRSGKQRRMAQDKRQRQRAMQVVDLAHAQKGRLTVTAVAGHLGMDFKEAEALLDTLVDGRRVDMQVDDQGRVTYVFTEIAG